MITAVATDIDGTFLNDNHQYNHQLFWQVVGKLQKANILLIMASGEQLDWCQQLVSPLENELAYVAANGALIAGQGGTIIHQDSLPSSLVSQAMSILNHLAHHCYVICTSQSGWVPKLAPLNFQRVMKRYYPCLHAISDVKQIKGAVIKIAVAVPERTMITQAKRLNQLLPSQLRAIVGGQGEIDVVKQGTNKATGLTYLLQAYHRSASDLLVFGDQENDRPMFQLAGHSAAVANAIPTIKQLADKIVPTNNDGGVLTTLDQLFN